MDESKQWAEFGRWLVEQREERGLRRREAAKRAKVPETTWRDLETGRKQAIGGIRLLPNPSKDVLERVAGALEVPLEDVLARVGGKTSARPARTGSANGQLGEGAIFETPEGAADGSVIALKLRRLCERDRALVEHLVDAMLQRAEG
ncbi:MAG TPA: helix-turn-helix domain-containing protein [Acidimicrobiales bacterium]|nr:helix-turn-helix domain-containing protein [Acidimicrobiales bacterium]